MRGIVLAVVAIQIGLADPASAENAEYRQSISRRSRCSAKIIAKYQGAAPSSYFAATPLNASAIKLNAAIQDPAQPARQSAASPSRKTPEWIRDRNSSCGILADKALRPRTSNPSGLPVEGNRRTNRNTGAIRISIAWRRIPLPDADMQRPLVGDGRMELNGHVLGLIARLKETTRKTPLPNTSDGAGSAIENAIWWARITSAGRAVVVRELPGRIHQ